MRNQKACRLCSHPLTEIFADLGMSPFANSYVAPGHLGRMEPFYPLCVFACSNCLLVQLEEFESPEAIFSDYAYFSSFSAAWLEHSRQYVDLMIPRFGLTGDSKVVEIASNDGYLLQYFVAKGIPVLGVEPAANVAEVAVRNGVPTRVMFFGEQTARQLSEEGHAADLIAGNNVFAHVPDLHSFVAGLKILLKPQGTITLEFPHLLQLLRHNQFDTIYHEHFSYLSLLAVERVMGEHGLGVFDVDQLPTHGGSLRIYAKHREDASRIGTAQLVEVRRMESAAHLDSIEAYRSFAPKIQKVKFDLLEFLIHQKREGNQVVGYGAPAKGNTLLNYCGVGPELLAYTVDRSPHKQGMFLPGTRIPIFSPERIAETKPAYVLILPWNLRDEVASQMSHIREWGGRFVVTIPELEVF
ncbi:MAG: class I SAM-dependent methyltransferase [Candidatus Solibacter sp.]